MLRASVWLLLMLLASLALGGNERLDFEADEAAWAALAADLTASADSQRKANVDGTQNALDLAAALGHGARRFHLVGHDWGGSLAWEIAAKHPERLASLAVLLAATAYYEGARNRRVAIVAALGAAFFWLLFVQFLGIAQPSGLWPSFD